MEFTPNLWGTEYNGSLARTGERGSVAVAQHSARTHWDGANKKGEVRLGAIADGRKGNHRLASFHATSWAKDPLVFDLSEASEDGVIDTLEISITRLDMTTEGADPGEEKAGVLVGRARASVHGELICRESGTVITFERTFPELIGGVTGELATVSYRDEPDEPTFRLGQPILLPRGDVCELWAEIQTRVDMVPSGIADQAAKTLPQ